MKQISFIIPVYNNFKYTKHIYENLKLYYPDDEIVISDGGSSDETIDYFTNIDDNNLLFINNGKLNLCENYNAGVEAANSDIIVLLHNDMFIPPNFKHRLLSDLDETSIISYARIEPPVFPGEEPGKIVRDFGFDLETLDTYKIIEFSETYTSSYEGGGYLFIACSKNNWIKMDELTFNPPQMWAADDDLHIRFRLSNFKLRISNAIVYHFVSKTSRVDSNYRDIEFHSNRNFIRKWGSRTNKHKYNIHAVIHNCNYQILELLEPWFAGIYCKCTDTFNWELYCNQEQKNTKFNLRDRIKNIDDLNMDVIDILVEFDVKQLTANSMNIIQNLSDILTESGEIGEFVLDCFKITITNLRTYEHQLIKL